MKALIPALNRLMPLMVAVMIVLGLIQLAIALNFSPALVLEWLSNLKAAYLPLAGVTALVALSGVFFDMHSDKLIRKGLRRRRGLLMDSLARLTNRDMLEALMEQQQRETTIDAEELAASLRARVIGQDQVCEDIAQQLRRRLALHIRNKPVGIFLLAGPPGTGKTYLAKQIAKQMERPLLHFDMTLMSDPQASTQLFGSPKGFMGSDSYGKLTGGLQEKPDAVVLLDEIEKAHPDVMKKFLTAWNDGHVTEASTGSHVSTTRAIFILTSNIATEALTEIAERLSHDAERMRAESTEALRNAGFAPEVLNRIDRILVFRRLHGLDLARVAALEIEAMIKGYGLNVEAGGIDAHLLFQLLQRQQKLGTGASARDLVRSIEDMVSETLILARQNSAKLVRLNMTETGVVAEIADEKQALNARLTP